ncbi:MAG: FixH family protein [Pyrinomonadaceae bacterium]
MRKIFVTVAFASLIGSVLHGFACSSGSTSTAINPISGQVIKTGPVGNLTVTLTSETGKLKNGDQEFMIVFTDGSGKAVDVGSAAINFQMPAMGSMSAMNEGATLTTTGTPGVYKGKVKIPMAGDWQAQITFEGPAGSGKTAIPISTQ